MENLYDDDRICFECVGDHFLRIEIETQGKRRKCAICGNTARTYSVEDLTDRVHDAFLAHYERTTDQMTDWQYYKQFVDKESSYEWDREGQTCEDILVNDLGFDATLAGDIIKRLQHRYYDMERAAMGEETEFDDEAKYEIKDIGEEKWFDLWKRFGDILKNQSRFFSPEATEILDSIFKDIDLFRTWRGRTVITTIGPRQKIDGLYRARVFQSRKKLLV